MARSVILALVFACIFTNALASGSISSASVTQVRVDQDGRGLVIFDQPLGGTPPACVGPSFTNALSFDANTAGGKSILAAALAAKATGATISAVGTGSCTIYGGSHVEDWYQGYVQ